MVMRGVVLALACAVAFMPAQARFAISGNDGHQLLPGEGRTPDSISVIDLGATQPKVIGTVEGPAAMIGPPNAVAVSADERFALVTAAQKFDAADPLHPAADDKVSVIALDGSPRLLQTVTAGAGASGIALNRAGTLALVAAKGADAVFIFTMQNQKLIPAGKIELGAGSAPTDVVFAPDGAHAYAVAWGAGQIMELVVEGARVTATGNNVVTGREPYGAVVTPDSRWLINTNVGGTGDDKTGSLTMVDLTTHKLAMVLRVGRTPEHISLSPDGRHAALVLANGAATSKSDPDYNRVLGKLVVFSVAPGALREMVRADTCHWAQGAAWSDDGRTILQQCATEREIQIFRFDGPSLVREDEATIRLQSRPGSIATHLSR
jgi:DNA-binding beta-propeller fold protein YncE